MENLINLVKDNPKFLLELQTKHQVEALNSLFTTKSPQEIITIIKRFEYNNLSPSDKENKTKKIKAYYQQLSKLAKNGKLTKEQINEYLYKEATEKLEKNLTNNKFDARESSNTSIIEIVTWIVGVFFTIALIALILRHLYHQIRRKKKVYQPTYPKNILENELSKFNDLNERWIKQSIDYNQRYIARRKMLVFFEFHLQILSFIEEELKSLRNKYE